MCEIVPATLRSLPPLSAVPAPVEVRIVEFQCVIVSDYLLQDRALSNDRLQNSSTVDCEIYGFYGSM